MPASQPQQPPAQSPQDNATNATPATVCGNGACEAGEDFVSCPADCAPTYNYIFEYVDGLSYAYKICDKSGSTEVCRSEDVLVQLGQPALFTGMKPLYNHYNTYTLIIMNDTLTAKKWVNQKSSECLLTDMPRTSEDEIFNCSKSGSIEFLGTEDVEVPFGKSGKQLFIAQKFAITFTPDPTKRPAEKITLLAWKVNGPLTYYPGFTVKKNIRVPVQLQYSWSYINPAGVRIYVTTTKTLKDYIEPYDFGG
ncbi:Uncharacterised protein [Candidatus Burarchaeum australiense]|nr:Uncharacterised protein [Candidatus Burarchaeum australiense]